jgi:Arc/MetJ-type ribon-helix-helix transcriptional regulator
MGTFSAQQALFLEGPQSLEVPVCHRMRRLDLHSLAPTRSRDPLLSPRIPITLAYDTNSNNIPHMKTIAISIDQKTLDAVDEVVARSSHLPNRSAVVRAAVRRFAEDELRRQTEERESAVLRKHRERLSRQVRALMKEQAQP